MLELQRRSPADEPAASTSTAPAMSSVSTRPRRLTVSPSARRGEPGRDGANEAAAARQDGRAATEVGDTERDGEEDGRCRLDRCRMERRRQGSSFVFRMLVAMVGRGVPGQGYLARF
jgi:hypothetical protein